MGGLSQFSVPPFPSYHLCLPGHSEKERKMGNIGTCVCFLGLQWKFIFPWFWMPEVQNQVIGRAPLPLKITGEKTFFFHLLVGLDLPGLEQYTRYLFPSSCHLFHVLFPLLFRGHFSLSIRPTSPNPEWFYLKIPNLIISVKNPLPTTFFSNEVTFSGWSLLPGLVLYHSRNQWKLQYYWQNIWSLSFSFVLQTMPT